MFVKGWPAEAPKIDPKVANGNIVLNSSLCRNAAEMAGTPLDRNSFISSDDTMKIARARKLPYRAPFLFAAYPRSLERTSKAIRVIDMLDACEPFCPHGSFRQQVLVSFDIGNDSTLNSYQPRHPPWYDLQVVLRSSSRSSCSSVISGSKRF